MPFFELERLPQTFAVVFADSLLDSVFDGGYGIVHEVPILTDGHGDFETAYIVSEPALKSARPLKYHWKTSQVTASFAERFYLTVPPCDLLLFSVEAEEYHQFRISSYHQNNQVISAIIGWNDIKAEVKSWGLTKKNMNLVLEMKHKEKCFPLK